MWLGKQLALVKTNSAVRTCGFDFGGNIIMFSTDKQMGYQCFVNFFDLRDPSQIGEAFGEGGQGGGGQQLRPWAGASEPLSIPLCPQRTTNRT